MPTRAVLNDGKVVAFTKSFTANGKTVRMRIRPGHKSFKALMRSHRLRHATTKQRAAMYRKGLRKVPPGLLPHLIEPKFKAAFRKAIETM